MEQKINIEYRIAESTSDFEEGKKMFLEYSDSLGFGLDFQDFQEELKQIDVKYGSPTGVLLVCFADNRPVGCVGVRKISKDVAELKRLYVKPEFRSLKIGGKLMSMALKEAKKIGYNFIRLDTIAEMQAAINLYKKIGFYEIAPYCFNSFETAIYMEKRL